MNKQKRNRRTGMRKALYLQVSSILVLLAVCLFLSVELGIWHAPLYEGLITFTSFLMIVMVLICVVVIFIAKTVFRNVVDLENAVNVLLAETEKEGAGYVDSTQSLTDLLQILLKREATAQIMTKQAEINALQNQINPHFLYNTLETIRGQALCSGENKIAETTKALADIFRYSISKKGAMIYLSEELANIDSYVKIYQIRFNEKFKIEQDIDKDIMDIKIPKLLVQPLIENAFKHGFETKPGKRRIFISAFRTEQRLEISVEDDGIGISPENLIILNEKLASNSSGTIDTMHDNHIGLENINSRIKLIYGQDYGVSVISSQNLGTKVILSLGIKPEGTY